jgi:hypothetical protein
MSFMLALGLYEKLLGLVGIVVVVTESVAALGIGEAGLLSAVNPC